MSGKLSLGSQNRRQRGGAGKRREGRVGNFWLPPQTSCLLSLAKGQLYRADMKVRDSRARSRNPDSALADPLEAFTACGVCGMGTSKSGGIEAGEGGSAARDKVFEWVPLPSLMSASLPLSLGPSWQLPPLSPSPSPSSPEFKRSDKRKATAVTAAAPDLPEVKADCGGKPQEERN